jgi:hypothetical protein
LADNEIKAQPFASTAGSGRCHVVFAVQHEDLQLRCVVGADNPTWTDIATAARGPGVVKIVLVDDFGRRTRVFNCSVSRLSVQLALMLPDDRPVSLERRVAELAICGADARMLDGMPSLVYRTELSAVEVSVVFAAETMLPDGLDTPVDYEGHVFAVNGAFEDVCCRAEF